MSRLLIIQSWQAGVFMAISAPKYVPPEMIPKLCSEEYLLIATLWWWWWWWWEPQIESRECEMLCTVLARVWNVNKKLTDSGRAGAFVRRQAACLSSYCLQRYLISEQEGMTKARTISIERMCENDICACCCHCAGGRHLVVSQITLCGVLVVVFRSPLGPTHLILWALGVGGISLL
jgi:hypothetical protein